MNNNKGRLVIDRDVGESFLIGDDIEVKIDSMRSLNTVRISIMAPRDVIINRKELIVKNGNR